MSKLWFGSSMRPYPGNEPPFYSPENFPWAKKMEENYSTIRKEVAHLIDESTLNKNANKLLYEHFTTDNKWSKLYLFWGAKVSNDLKKCKVLNSLLQQIPGLVSVGISCLGPHSSIPEHNGDTNGTMRCHYSIDTPDSSPACGLKVAGEERYYSNGKWIIFNDGHKHSSWNNTEQRRVIFIIDVVKPDFIQKKNFISAMVITRYASYYYNRFKLIAKSPVFIKTILFAIVLGAVFILRPVYNFFK